MRLFPILSLLVLVSSTFAGSLGSIDFSSAAAPKEPVYANIKNGTLKGTTTTTSGINGPRRTIYSFKKIPYAKPPTGDLRFEPPQPLVGGWGEGEYDASSTPPACPQFLTNLVPASEDCLFLSVHTPLNPSEPITTKLPVMFFVHGGGFILGDSVLYGPNRLLSKDVILVTVHYRLGALGFLSTNDSVVPGNMGLKDQVQALRWVNENIEAFGGDPKQVTIFGESAGSASVMFLLISPLTEGLFQGVIAQSGTPLSIWAMDSTPLKSAQRYGETLDCPIDTSLNLVECLRKKTWQELAQNSFTNLVEDISQLRLVFEASAPVIEPDLPGAFISRPPLEIFKEGPIPNVPVMLGAVQHEGSAVLAAAYALNLGRSGKLEDPEYVREELLPVLLKALGIDETTGTGAPITQSLALAFLPGFKRNNFTEITEGLVDLLSVAVFKASVLRTADLLTRHTDRVYLYSFERQGYNSLWILLFNLIGAILGSEPIPIQHGVMHADDLQFIFPLPFIISGNDSIVSNMMCTIWTNFATTGAPIPTDDTSLPSWVPYTIEGGNYYKLDFQPEACVDYTSSWRLGFEYGQTCARN